MRVTREFAGGYATRPVPDLLAYLQNETELTRSTLVGILTGSDRLGEFFNDPQRFMSYKVRCGIAHLKAIDVSFDVISDASEV